MYHHLILISSLKLINYLKGAIRKDYLYLPYSKIGIIYL